MGNTTCATCGRDYAGDLYSLHYCLCETTVCSACIEGGKVETEGAGKRWRCPKCGKWLDEAESRLFKVEG
ncbi:MAG: hypothetical protein ACTSU5_15110 [Promethearchaeota archaeon]